MRAAGTGSPEGEAELCWLAGFCLVVDLKCRFVETVAYPMGSALHILCNTLLARNVVCCIFVLCCCYTIITLFLWRQLASLFVMLDSAGDQVWNLRQYTSITPGLWLLNYRIVIYALGEYSVVNSCSGEGDCCFDWLGRFSLPRNRNRIFYVARVTKLHE